MLFLWIEDLAAVIGTYELMHTAAVVEGEPEH